MGHMFCQASPGVDEWRMWLLSPPGMVKSHCQALILITPDRSGFLEVPSIALNPQKALLCADLCVWPPATFRTFCLSYSLSVIQSSCCSAAGMSRVPLVFKHALSLAEAFFFFSFSHGS